VVGVTDSALVGSAQDWPLVVTLAEVNGQWGDKAAELVWTALNTVRTREPATDAVRGWMRAAARDERLLGALCRFLPRLVVEQRDRSRLYDVIDKLVHDPDNPLPARVARVLWRSLQEEAAE
jgi:hypothetical protein